MLASISTLFACMHPLARGIIVVLIAAGLVHMAVSWLRQHRIRWLSPAAYILLILATLWLGMLPISPLGFASGRIPLLRGFRITRPQRPSADVASREAVSLSPGTPMEIEPILLPGPVHCLWAASNGGSFEDPVSCDTAYEPAARASYDLLHVRIQSECKLPSVSGEIRISILP